MSHQTSERDLSDFDCGMIVGGDLSVSETADLLGSSHTQQSEKQEEKNIQWAVLDGNASLVREVSGKEAAVTADYHSLQAEKHLRMWRRPCREI